jgi:lactate dehydrogenase-like 2-hydroxyacid dehydrogenase
MVGCPVLISDRTPWNRMEEKGIGHEISLSSMGRFSHIIKLYCSYNKDEYLLVRNKVIDYVSNNMSQDILEDKYKQFFNKLCFQNN